MSLSLAENSGRVLQYGGFVFTCDYSSTAKITDNAIAFLNGAVLATTTDLILENSKGLPTTGSLFAPNGETMTITANNYTTNTVTVTRGTTPAPAAIADGAAVIYVYTLGYSASIIQNVGYVDNIALTFGKKARTMRYDNMGRAYAAKKEPDDPEIKFTLAQTGINETAMNAGRDVDSATVNSMYRMSKTAKADMAFIICTYEQDMNGNMVYGFLRIPHAQLSTSSDWVGQNDVKTYELTYKCLYNSVVEDNYVIDKTV